MDKHHLLDNLYISDFWRYIKSDQIRLTPHLFNSNTPLEKVFEALIKFFKVNPFLPNLIYYIFDERVYLLLFHSLYFLQL